MSRLIKCDRCGYTVTDSQRLTTSAPEACAMTRNEGVTVTADLCDSCWSEARRVFTERKPEVRPV